MSACLVEEGFIGRGGVPWASLSGTLHEVSKVSTSYRVTVVRDRIPWSSGSGPGPGLGLAWLGWAVWKSAEPLKEERQVSKRCEATLCQGVELF